MTNQYLITLSIGFVDVTIEIFGVTFILIPIKEIKHADNFLICIVKKFLLKTFDAPNQKHKKINQESVRKFWKEVMYYNEAKSFLNWYTLLFYQIEP